MGIDPVSLAVMGGIGADDRCGGTLFSGSSTAAADAYQAAVAANNAKLASNRASSIFRPARFRPSIRASRPAPRSVRKRQHRALLASTSIPVRRSTCARHRATRGIERTDNPIRRGKEGLFRRSHRSVRYRAGRARYVRGRDGDDGKRNRRGRYAALRRKHGRCELCEDATGSQSRRRRGFGAVAHGLASTEL